MDKDKREVASILLLNGMLSSGKVSLKEVDKEAVKQCVAYVDALSEELANPKEEIPA